MGFRWSEVQILSPRPVFLSHDLFIRIALTVRILLSNDDGYLAPGLGSLARALGELAEVTVVAPDRNRSGSSNSLTLNNPLRLYRAESGFYYVDGTPTDCVHLGITGLMKDEPDMVVAGVNAGANLGDDVLYSGTVAAAMEGRFLGYPALAVSLVGEEPQHFDTAARVALRVIRAMQNDPPRADSILNINVPDVAFADLAGMVATRLGHRHKSEPVIRGEDPYGAPIYWVGPPGREQDAGEGTDFHAVRHGLVSVTPLKVDLTRHEDVADMGTWLGGLTL
jgi:5'-nucleotidase